MSTHSKMKYCRGVSRMLEIEGKILNVSDRASSIELTKTTKGYTWSVKLYCNLDNDEQVKAAIERVEDIDAKLKAQFEYPETTKGGQ